MVLSEIKERVKRELEGDIVGFEPLGSTCILGVQYEMGMVVMELAGCKEAYWVISDSVSGIGTYAVGRKGDIIGFENLDNAFSFHVGVSVRIATGHSFVKNGIAPESKIMDLVEEECHDQYKSDPDLHG